MAPLRLAILECDSPSFPNFLATHGNLTTVFKLLFSRALPLLSSPPPPDPFTITRHHIVSPPEPAAGLPATPCPESSYPNLDEVDALLISGSKHDAWADHPWVLELVEFVKGALGSGRVKVIGVCFGHQIIARALGAQVRVAPGGREAAVDTVELTEEGKRVFGLERMRIQQMHRDDVAAVPDGATLLGFSAKCPVQSFYRPGRYLAVQGHPETTPDIMTEVLTVRHEIGLFTTEFYEEAMTRARLEDDGVQIGKVFLEFLM